MTTTENKENLNPEPKQPIESEQSPNIIVSPKDQPQPSPNPKLEQSSMITYSKIICCLCSAVMEANPRGICDTCAKKYINLTSKITKSYTIDYCKACGSYLKPPWIKCEWESNELMSLCLSKIKGLNKRAKIIDTKFVWTEPHSNVIKIQITVQEEVENIKELNVSQNIILEFKLNYFQCNICTKKQTPHFWYGSTQIRMKHGAFYQKKTLLYLEQIILKNKMNKNVLAINEVDEGVDFFFNSKHDAQVFADFISNYIPSKKTMTKHHVSHVTQQHTFILEVPSIWKGDLIFISKQNRKLFGGISPILIVDKIGSKIRLVDSISFKLIELDGNTFWKYDFKSWIDNSNKNLQEFLIIDVEEEINYKQKYKKDQNNQINNSNNDEPSSEIGTESLMSKSTNYKNLPNSNSLNENDYREELNKCKKMTVKCIRNNPTTDDNDDENNLNNPNNIIEVKSHLAMKIKPGDIYYGYDMRLINVSYVGNCDILLTEAENIPEIILIKKKNTENMNSDVKLKRLNIEKNEKKGEKENEKKDKKGDKDKKGKGKKGKKGKNKGNDDEEDDENLGEFIDDVMGNEDMKENIAIDKGDDDEEGSLDDEEKKELEELMKKDDKDKDKKNNDEINTNKDK